MALTSNNSLSELTKEFNQFKEDIFAALENINKKLDQLDERLFQERILSAPDESWDIIRKKRDYLLSSTDWTMIPGATIDQAAWAAYRQVLRDLPQTYKSKNPKSIAWPKKPPLSGPNTTQLK